MTKFPMGKVARIASIALGVSMFFSMVTPAGAATIDDLLAQIAGLQAQLLAMQGGTSASCNFTMDLRMGQSNSQVMDLQKYLNAHGATVSASGAGAPGQETMYFGARTKAAVMVWQNMHAAQVLAPAGLSGGTGFFGMYSRTYANTTCGSVVVTPPGTVPPVVTGGSAMVTAGTQPAASLAPQSAARVPFTRFTITTGATAVTLNSVEVDRTGLAQDAVFSGIVLLDGNGLQLGIAKTLNSLHHVTIGAPIVIPANSSMTFTVAGNMASSLSSYAGQVATLSVVGINTDGTVSGSFPITGAGQTINASLTLGAATLIASSFDPLSAQTKNVGDANVKFAGVRITAGSAEDVRLWSIRWNQSGSAASGDLANLNVYIDGTAYPVMASSDGKYFTAKFGSGIVISKGLTKDVYIQGDLVGSGAANRTVQFDIYKNTDIYLSGENFGYGITPSANGNCATATTNNTEFVYSSASCAGTAGSPFFSGSVITINAGTATTITKATEVAAQNIAVNVPNQILGGYAADFKGEPVTVQSTIFTFATSSQWTGASGVITNISIYDESGKVVAGPVDEASTCTTACSVTFTDSITYPVGRHVYTLKGKIPTGVTNGGTVAVTSTPSSGWTNVTGQVTGNSVSLSGNGAFTMNTMTIKAAALAVTVSATPSAQNVVAGSQGFIFANLQLDASQSGEDIRVTSVPMGLTYGTGPAAGNEISACQLWDGATAITTGSNIFNGPSATTSNPTTNTFTFDNSITVTKGTVKTLAMKCNVSGSATANETFKWGLTSTQIGNIAATGITSSGTVTATGATNAGQAMTVSAAGSLVASTDASTPGYFVASAGSTGVTVGVYKLRATNEDVNVDRIGLQLTNTASSSASDLVAVHLYDGATWIGDAVFTGANITATSTLNTVLKVTRDTDKMLTIKADFGMIGVSAPATEGHIIAIDIDTNGASGNGNTRGTGAQSGTTINGSGSTAVAGVRLFKSYPVLAADSLPGSGVSDGRLLRFKVTATNGDLGLNKFTFLLSTTSATVTGLNLFGYTDSAYSQAISGVSTGGQISASNLAPSTAGNDINLYAQTSASASTTIQVPAGQTRYFELRGTVTGTATTYSVTATLKGDAAYPSLPNALAAATNNFVSSLAGSVDVGTNDNFLWSPNATTSVTVAANDWTNGFGVAGLPQNGIIQTRSN